MALNRTAQDVAEIEGDNVRLTADNIHLRTQLSIAHSELTDLRARVISAEAEAREQLVIASQMESILQMTSLGLVTGLQKMKDQRAQERDARRARQLHHIEQEHRDTAQAAPPAEAVREPAHEPAHIEEPAHPRDLDEAHAQYARGGSLGDGTRPRMPAGSLAAEARLRVGEMPSEQTVRDAAELVGRPLLHRDPPLFLRTARPQDPRTDIQDSRLPKVEMLEAGEADIRNRAAEARAARGGERG